MSFDSREQSDLGDGPHSLDVPRANVEWRAIRTTLDQIGYKWHPSIIDELLVESPQRFSDLEARLDGISDSTLSNSLEDLQQRELVTRTVRETKPVQIEYDLTDRGRSLEPVLESLKTWGESNVCTKRLIQNKYHPLILHSLMTNGKLYFAELKTETGATNKSLSDSLGLLTDTGIVKRSVEAGKPVRVSYSLTDRGVSLTPVFQSLATWGQRDLGIEED